MVKKLHMDLAVLANLSYQNIILKSSLPKGWYQISKSTASPEIYQAYAFSNGKINVIAHRGSQNKIDVFNDLQLYLTSQPMQVNTGMFFLRSVEKEFGKVDIHTGHSLGGAIAQLIAIKTMVSAVTFDAPGIAQLVGNIKNAAGIVEYLAAPNIVNTAGKHVGAKYMVNIKIDKMEASLHFASYITHTLNQHSMLNIIKGLKNKSVDFVKTWPNGFFNGYKYCINYEHNKIYLDKFIAKSWDELSMDTFLLAGGNIAMNLIHTKDFLDITSYQVKVVLQGIAFSLSTKMLKTDTLSTILSAAGFPEHLLKYHIIHRTDFSHFSEFKEFVINTYFSNQQTYMMEKLEPLILKMVAQYNVKATLDMVADIFNIYDFINSIHSLIADNDGEIIKMDCLDTQDEQCMQIDL